MKNHLSQKNSFTLIEIVIVVIIIGILMVLGVPRYMDTVQKAKQKDVKSMIRLISNAQWLLEAKGLPFYPTSGTALIGDINQNLNLSILQPSDVVYECRAKAAGADFDCHGYHPDKSSPRWTISTGIDKSVQELFCTAGTGGKCF